MYVVQYSTYYSKYEDTCTSSLVQYDTGASVHNVLTAAAATEQAEVVRLSTK